MGMFLNSCVPYEGYREVIRDIYFVDKSLFLSELIPSFEKRNRYCCITRPRRFGKTVMANMVGAFFGKTDKKDRIFDELAISKKIYMLTDNQLRNYWTSSGPYDELFYYIRNNIEDVRDDLTLMVSGESVASEIGQFAAASMEINTREQIYSAMVVYGLLTYEEGKVMIPNKELMDKFNELLLSKNTLGYVYCLARKSEQMLDATIAGDTKMIEEILQFAHDTEAPILSYNSEVELSAVVNLCYLSARNKYRVEREEKAGKGFVDFIFYPERKSDDCIILELKVNSSPKEAIRQIKNKEYAFRFKGKLGETPKYTGRILAVGISYEKETKEHHCEIEILNP